MTTGERNLGQVDNPRLDLAFETLKEIRKCQLAFQQEERDYAKLFKRLRDLWAHQQFITSWASKESLGLALCGLALDANESIIGLMHNKKIFKKQLPDLFIGALICKIENNFETVSVLAHSAANEFIKQKDSIRKTKKDIEDKIEALRDELSALMFIESNVI